MYIKVIKNPNHGFACFPNVNLVGENHTRQRRSYFTVLARFFFFFATMAKEACSHC
jgi:DNA-binding transcriptional regulator GbsR (MarR family)